MSIALCSQVSHLFFLLCRTQAAGAQTISCLNPCSVFNVLSVNWISLSTPMEGTKGLST